MRTDGLALELCKYGYCFVTQNNEVYSQQALSSLGMGWSYIIIPLLIGVFVGIIFTFLILKKKQTKTEAETLK